MSIEGAGAIIAGLVVIVYIIKMKNKLKRFILRRSSEIRYFWGNQKQEVF